MTRTEDTPLVVRPGEDVYDWSVRPRGALLPCVPASSLALRRGQALTLPLRRLDSRVFNFLMLMRNFSCCGATCIVRPPPATSCLPSRLLTPARMSCPPAQLPEDDDEMPSVVSRGELMRMARDASAMLGGQPQAPVEAELQHMQAPTQAARPRLRSVDDEGD